jgi:competence protein ComEC
MKIKKNAFEKNGRKTKTVLASFLTLLAVSTVACTKEDAKKEEQSIKEVATVPKKEEKKEEEKTLIEERPSILSITYLNVGQGNSVFIECDDHYMLIDGGASDQSSKIHSFLEKKDIEKLHLVVATNTKEENVGGLAAALKEYDCDMVLAPTNEAANEAYAKFLEYTEKNSKSVTVPKVNDTYTLGDAKISVLACASKIDAAQSIILQIQHFDTKYLFSSDVKTEEEGALCKRYGEALKSDVLFIGNHGSSISSSDAFLDTVNPKIAILSVDGNDGSGLPESKVLDALHQRNIDLYRTDFNGDIKLLSDGKSINISTTKKANLNQLLTPGFIPTPTPEPTPTPTPKPTSTPTPEPVVEEQKPIEQYYIINTNTGKFHYPTCRSIKRMKDKNKLEFTGTRDDVLARGYSPCMICNP